MALRDNRLRLTAYGLLLALTLSALTMTASAATVTSSTETPIPASKCTTINSDPVPACASPPAVASNDVLRNLPYDSFGYEKCVSARCACLSAEYVAGNGISCNATTTGSLFDEDGALTCNQLSDCFTYFWKCVTTNLMERVESKEVPYPPPAVSPSAESIAANAMIEDGQVPGMPFDQTVTFESCRAITCEAAASRRNCGLITCQLNYTQCFQYLRPIPVPYKHHLCTQGCQAALVMMSLTLVFFASAFLCCCMCPGQVRRIEPLLLADALSSKGSRHGSKKSRGGSHASGSQHE